MKRQTGIMVAIVTHN